ncbi:MAG: hypothetical protein WBM97_22305 [Sedimenticolaceae bacterium]
MIENAEDYKVLDLTKEWPNIYPHAHNPRVVAALEEGMNTWLDTYPGVNLSPRRREPHPWSLAAALAGEDLAPCQFLTSDFVGAWLEVNADRATESDPFPDPDPARDPIWWAGVGTSHHLARFARELAQLAYPDGEWTVLDGADHSTVVDIRNRRVFDLVHHHGPVNPITFVSGGYAAVESEEPKIFCWPAAPLETSELLPGIGLRVLWSRFTPESDSGREALSLGQKEE